MMETIREVPESLNDAEIVFSARMVDSEEEKRNRLQ